MTSFVDHLQFLPVPSVRGVRQPDGDHRPGGLGMLTIAERLERRGWTPRIEDIGFDKRLPEKRIAESYARSIADGVLSAWDRDRFPIVLSRVNHGALGVVDALAPEVALLWVAPRLEYARPGLLRRPAFDRRTLALVTGRAGRDSLAVQPRRVAASRIVVVDASRAPFGERRDFLADGGRIVAGSRPEELRAALDEVGAGTWAVHVDLSALEAGAAPNADEARPGGLAPQAVVAAVEALPEVTIRCLTLARYDLNRCDPRVTLETLVALVEAGARAAGGQPRPGAVDELQEA